MKMRTGSLLAVAALATAGMSALVTGCELIASVDRSTIPSSSTGGSSGTGGTTATTGGEMTTATTGGGTSASSSSSGGATCVDPAKDCPAPANECVTAICNSGACDVSNVADGGTVTTQTPGDCKKDVCDGAGKIKSIDDDTDVNDDAKECTVDTCTAGAPVHTPKAAKTACGMGGTLKCDVAGACVGCVDITDCGTPPACKVNTCTAGVCGTANAADASACSDGSLCTQSDSCQAGVCTGTNPVVCTAIDQCHNAGACAPATGVCSTSVPKGDGAACSDNNLCTQTDTCIVGVCTGSNPVTCAAPDQCHDVSTCAPATGLCPLMPKANGAVCTDGNACTTPDTCQAGACTSTPVVCTALDDCHDVGTCGVGGTCTNPVKGDGSPCANGTKTCTAGVCM